jgi:hypothetical protein
LIDLVNRRDRMLAGVLRSCQPIDGASARLVIGAPYGFHHEHLQNRLSKLNELVAQFTGAAVAVALQSVLKRSDAGDPAAPGDPEAPPASEPRADVAQAVQEVFPGSVVTGERLRDHAHE